MIDSRSPITRRRRGVGLVLAVVTSALAVVLGAPAASAAPEQLGELTFYPGKGSDVTPMYVITEGPCPAAATNTVTRAFGKGFPAEGQVIVPNSTANLSRTDQFLLPLQDTMRGFASVYGIALSGPYRIVLTCQSRLGDKQYGTFAGVVTFTAPNSYRAKETPLTLPGVDEPAPSTSAKPGASALPGASGGAAAPGNGASSVPTAPAGSGAPSTSAGADGGLSVAGGDTNAGSANPVVSRVVDGGPSRWLLLALGALLVLLGLGWFVRGRGSRGPGASDPGTSDPDAGGVGPGEQSDDHDYATTTTETS